MPVATATIDVKVLAHWTIQQFSGQAVLAAITPRFVVCVLIANTRDKWQVPGTDVSLGTQRVAFFAIDSITKVFAESDVIGKDFTLRVEMLTIEGKASYTIGIAD